MTAAEQLAVWRAEIAAELEQLQTELATARGELAEAERQVGRLKDAQSDLEATCRRGLGNSSPGQALALWGRLRDARREMKREIARIRGSLPARVEAFEHTIADRRLALVQIDLALEDEHPRHVPQVVKRPPGPAVSPYEVAESRH